MDHKNEFGVISDQGNQSKSNLYIFAESAPDVPESPEVTSELTFENVPERYYFPVQT